MITLRAWLWAAPLALAAALLAPTAAADVAPVPPDCSAEKLDQACTFANELDELDGVCMQGNDLEYYCKVGNDCYPTELTNGWNVAVSCPPPAPRPASDPGDDGGGCAVPARDHATGVSAVACMLVAAVALATLRRRRTR